MLSKIRPKHNQGKGIELMPGFVCVACWAEMKANHQHNEAQLFVPAGSCGGVYGGGMQDTKGLVLSIHRIDPFHTAMHPPEQLQPNTRQNERGQTPA